MKLPSIVKQIGPVSAKHKVYIEDYVYSYLRKLKEEGHMFPIRVALYGYAFQKEKDQYYLIQGACDTIATFEDEESPETIGKRFFTDYHLIGYINLYRGTMLPGEKDGCYIFYEKNEAMQNFLISCYRRETKKSDGEEISHKEKKGRKSDEKSGFIRAVLEKLVLMGLVLLIAVAAGILNQYDGMYNFISMMEKAVKLSG